MRLSLMFLFVLGMCCLSSAAEMPSDSRPKLFHRFGDFATNPDGMAIDKAGNLYIASPNFNNKAYPAVIVKFEQAKGDRSSIWFVPPAHPETGRGGPMGMEFGPDGNLYYADNQYFDNKNGKSRLMRVLVENGLPVRAECVVEGFNLSNAVRWRGNCVYVSDTFFDVDRSFFGGKDKHQSGVYRIPMDAWKNGPVKLLPKKNADADPYCIAICETTLNSRRDSAGADGVCFDKAGNLYVGNFGDGKLHRVSFSGDGRPNKPEILDTSTTCVDGICYDAKRDWVIITDSAANAVRYWDVKAGKMGLIWENGDCDGSDGLLDQPCEPFLVDDQLIIACFDMPFPGLKNQTFDNVNTMSVIDLSSRSACPVLRMIGF